MDHRARTRARRIFHRTHNFRLRLRYFFFPGAFFTAGFFAGATLNVAAEALSCFASAALVGSSASDVKSVVCA